MSALTAPEIRTAARGETTKIYIDWGENTPSEKTGCLAAGDTVATCTVSVNSRPSGAVQADDPILGTVTVPSQTSPEDDINGRIWSAGEATTCTIQVGASQALGEYVLKFTATTTNGYVLPRFVRVVVGNA